jgi:hypothetical protein
MSSKHAIERALPQWTAGRALGLVSARKKYPGSSTAPDRAALPPRAGNHAKTGGNIEFLLSDANSPWAN